jgi:hypothetical protein
VESQIESHQSGRRSGGERQLTPEQIERRREKANLLLSRTRVLHDLEECRNPRYRKILQESLAFLDVKLAALK